MLKKKLNPCRGCRGKDIKEMMRKEMTDMEDHEWRSKREKAGINES